MGKLIQQERGSASTVNRSRTGAGRYLALGLIWLLWLTGCAKDATAGTQGEVKNDTDIASDMAEDSQNAENPGDIGSNAKLTEADAGDMPEGVTRRFEILEATDQGLLVCGVEEVDQGLYCVSHGDQRKAADGTALSVNELTPGMVVDLTWEGDILESYPGQFGYEALQVTEEPVQKEFLFYRQLLQELTETDAGLQSGIDACYLDLSQVASLRDGEKEGLAYLAGGDLGVWGSLATAKELREQEILDPERGLEAAILFTVEEISHTEEGIICNAEKYRGPLGAYYYRDVTAEYQNGAWTWEIGSQMIS